MACRQMSGGGQRASACRASFPLFWRRHSLMSMSSPQAADRNLLFGILALQMDFVKRDALLAAMQAWVFNKTTSLGQILREQNVIGAEEEELLEALVRKHLQRP